MVVINDDSKHYEIPLVIIAYIQMLNSESCDSTSV